MVAEMIPVKKPRSLAGLAAKVSAVVLPKEKATVRLAMAGEQKHTQGSRFRKSSI